MQIRPRNDKKIMGKHSIVIHSHRTSITLENEFWAALKIMADQQNRSVASIVTEIDDTRTTNLSSALRVHVLTYFMDNPSNGAA